MRTDWPCIEITKTTPWEARDTPGEQLPDYEALLRWAREHEVIGESELRLRELARLDPERAERVVERARALRGLIYRLLSSLATGNDPAADDTTELNRLLSEAGTHRVIRIGPDACEWSWEDSSDPLEYPLWPVVWSVGELLTSEERARLRLCDAHDCGWLFIDASRNRSRRWCDMGGCGNREKVRRYRERQRSE